jgi:hypothetical protein
MRMSPPPLLTAFSDEAAVASAAPTSFVMPPAALTCR